MHPALLLGPCLGPGPCPHPSTNALKVQIQTQISPAPAGPPKPKPTPHQATLIITDISSTPRAAPPAPSISSWTRATPLSGPQKHHWHIQLSQWLPAEVRSLGCCENTLYSESRNCYLRVRSYGSGGDWFVGLTACFAAPSLPQGKLPPRARTRATGTTPPSPQAPPS